MAYEELTKLSGIKRHLEDNKSALNVTDNEVFYPTEITAASTADGWRLNESDGFCSSNSDYKLVKYAVSAGDVIKIVSDDRFQFQTVASVPASGTSNRVGKTYGAGTFYLEVPSTATYLIVSTPSTSNAAVYSTISVKDQISNVESDLKNEINTDEYFIHTGSYTVTQDQIIRGGVNSDGSPSAATSVIRPKPLYFIPKGSSFVITPGTKCAKCIVAQYTLNRVFVKYTTPSQLWSTDPVSYNSDVDALYVFMFMSASGELLASDYDGSIKIYTKIQLTKKHNVVAYVSGNAIEWVNNGTACSLIISDSIYIKTYYGGVDVNIVISKSDVLTAASAYSSVTVSGDTISGNAFCLYYDFNTSSVKVGATDSLDTFKNACILFFHHWASVTTGELVISALNYKVNGIGSVLAKKKQNAIAYVSGNAFEWARVGYGCSVTISGSIIIRTNTGISDPSIIITKDAVLAAAALSSDVSVSGDTITGNAFCIYYDFDTSSVKVSGTSDTNCYKNTCILFLNHWASITMGEIFNSYLTEKVKNIDADVSKLKGDVPSYLESEVSSTVSSLVDTCDEKSFVVVFTTDNHYGASNGMNWPQTATVISAINKRYPVDAVIDGGDATNGDETKAKDIERIQEIVHDLEAVNHNAYTLVGNHDDGSFTAQEEPLLSAGELYALFGRHMTTDVDNIGEDKSYGFKDFESLGIRLILLDSHISNGSNGADPTTWGYDTDQISWLENEALNTSNQVMIFSHMGVTQEYSAANIQPVNGVTVREKIESFIANGGTVIGFFHGHTHWDFIGKKSVTNGFYEVSTGCGRIESGPSPSQVYYPTGATKPERTAGTSTQELFDIIVVKPESRTVDMIRFGAGSDRNFTY